MFQQLINSIIKPSRSQIADIMFDIDLFFNYLNQYGQIIDVWYFQNVFTSNYWEYLGNYNWLSQKKQDFIHQGIMSIVLTMCYQHMEQTRKISSSNQDSILRSLEHFRSDNVKSKKLRNIVISSMNLIKEQNTENYSEETKSEIYNSILWTIKNIILINILLYFH